NCALYFMVLGSGNAVVSQLFCGRRVLGFGDENAGCPSLVEELCCFARAPRLAATQDFHGVCLMERVGNYQKGRHPGQDRLSKEIGSSSCRQEKQNRNEQNVPVFLSHRFLRLSVNRPSIKVSNASKGTFLDSCRWSLEVKNATTDEHRAAQP